jgi:hypothetical protein
MKEQRNDVGTFTYFCLAPRLRISGAVPLLSIYAFMTWRETLL